MKGKKDTKDIITLIKCFSCKRNFIFDIMKPVNIKEPFEESYQTLKRFICPDCYTRLEQKKFVMENEYKEDKDETKDKKSKEAFKE